jgi:hypothetical protein
MNTTVLGFASILLGGIAITPLLVETDHGSPPAFEAPAAAGIACVDRLERPRLTDLQPQGTAPDCLPAVSLRMAAAR